MARITNRDPEFQTVITIFYREELGRDPDPGGLTAFMELARNGWTGEQIRQTIHDSEEGKLHRAQLAQAPPPAPAVEALVATASGLQTGSGRPYTWAHVDSFRAKERVQLGEDIRGVLDEYLEVGANGIRVLDDAEWFRVHSSGNISQAIDAILALGVLLRQRGLYGQYCVFADWQQCWGGNLGRAQQYLRDVTQALREYPGWILQLVNEGNQHQQNFPFASFNLPGDLLCSRGSQGTGDDPPMPTEGAPSGAYLGNPTLYHDLGSERRFGKLPLSTATIFYAINGYEGEAGRPGYPGTQWPTVVSEPPGIGDGAARYGDPEGCYYMGLGTRADPQGRACGGTAHADDCLQTVPMRGLTKACVSAFLQGVKAGRR